MRHPGEENVDQTNVPSLRRPEDRGGALLVAGQQQVGVLYFAQSLYVGFPNEIVNLLYLFL